MTLQTQRVQTLEQVHRVAAGEEPVQFEVLGRASAYDFIRRTLVQFDYAALGKADKGAVLFLAIGRGISTRIDRSFRRRIEWDDGAIRGPAATSLPPARD